MVILGRLARISLLLLVVLVYTSVPVHADSPPGKPEYSPGHILVKLKPGVTVQEVSGGKPIPQIGVVSIPVEQGHEIDASQRLMQNPGVEFAEPDYLVRAFETPNDPLFGFYQWNLRMIRAEQAWDITVGKSDVTIAILDTGVDLSHPDLAAKIVPGLNVLDPSSPPQDDNGHGSHVAGIAAAVSNNGRGVAGVSWGAKILPVKVLDSSGVGTVEDLATGIIWAADHGARVMNVSSGAEGLSQTLQSAVNYAHDTKGALIAASVGNDGGFGGFNPPYYPAAFPNVMGVAATDSNDRRAEFSETGPFVAVAAPGVTIVSSVIHGQGNPGLGGDYDYDTGTSMAAPHVAGLAALLWSANPNLSNDQVAGLIESTAVDLGAAGKDNFFGYGRIDAYSALRAATSGIISPSPRSLQLMSDLEVREPVVRGLSIANLGGKAFAWTAVVSPTVPWLSLAQPSGQVDMLSTSAISVTATIAGITSPGAYTTSLVLSGQGNVQNSPVAIPVSLEVVGRLSRQYLPLIAQSTVAGW